MSHTLVTLSHNRLRQPPIPPRLPVLCARTQYLLKISILSFTKTSLLHSILTKKPTLFLLFPVLPVVFSRLLCYPHSRPPQTLHTWKPWGGIEAHRSLRPLLRLPPPGADTTLPLLPQSLYAVGVRQMRRCCPLTLCPESISPHLT